MDPYNQNRRLALHNAAGYAPMTLTDIHQRIQTLFTQLPPLPANGFRADAPNPSAAAAAEASQFTYDRQQIRTWASELHSILEEYTLLLCCVGPATYTGRTTLSGAAEQSLNVLAGETAWSEAQLSSPQIRGRINRVMFPPETLVRDRVVTSNLEDGRTSSQYHYRAARDDEALVDQSYADLAQNARWIRQVVLANLDRFLSALSDFMEAWQEHDDHRPDVHMN